VAAGGQVSAQTGINWTDSTWNPIRGCSRVSPGCENCYAESTAARFSGPGMPYEGLAKPSARGLPKWTGEVRFIEEHLADPLRWRRPRRIFVNSMSDLFHERLPNEEIAAVFGVMAAAPRHTFQVLTKRPERMREWFRWIADEGDELLAVVDEEPPSGSPIPGACACFAKEKAIGGVLRDKDWREAMRAPWPLPNVWLGVTAEDQQRLDERVPILLDTPAAVRWVSAEPLLGQLDLTRIDAEAKARVDGMYQINPLTGRNTDMGRPCRDVARLDWIVVGGESGPRARPFDLAWARSIVDQCQTAGVPIWVKQLGADPIDGTAGCSVWQRDKAGADWTDWPAELKVRRFPEARA
jgi:protein gp37